MEIEERLQQLREAVAVFDTFRLKYHDDGLGWEVHFHKRGQVVWSYVTKNLKVWLDGGVHMTSDEVVNMMREALCITKMEDYHIAKVLKAEEIPTIKIERWWGKLEKVAA